MIYKIVLTLLIVFSIKAFSQDTLQDDDSNKQVKGLSTKQLEIIIKSIKTSK